jgi:hypothetical protein
MFQVEVECGMMGSNLNTVAARALHPATLTVPTHTTRKSMPQAIK